MSKPNPADLPGSMAILGLLIEAADEMTVAEVNEGLKTRFKTCRFDPGTARHTLRQMARNDDRCRPRVTCTYKAPGRSRMNDRYVPTRLGAREFDGWMHERPIGTPALREALYGRIELCRSLEDLPELIRIAREERQIAGSLYTNAKSDLQLHLDIARRHPPRGKPGPEDFLREVRGVLTQIMPEYWSARSVHFDEIARHLEDIAERAGVAFAPDPNP